MDGNAAKGEAAALKVKEGVTSSCEVMEQAVEALEVWVMLLRM